MNELNEILTAANFVAGDSTSKMSGENGIDNSVNRLVTDNVSLYEDVKLLDRGTLEIAEG